MPQPPLQIPDLDAHLLAQLGVQVGERLVEQQDVRPRHDGARQRHALLLPAGEFARPPLLEAAQAHHVQRLGDAALLLRRRQLPHAQAEGDVVRHRHVGKQRIGLEHHRGVAPVRRHVGHVAVAEPDLAAVGRDEAGHHPQRRGLAAAGRPEQRDELAIGHIERDIIDGGEAAITPRHMGQRQRAHRCVGRRSHRRPQAQGGLQASDPASLESPWQTRAPTQDDLKVA